MRHSQRPIRPAAIRTSCSGWVRSGSTRGSRSCSARVPGSARTRPGLHLRLVGGERTAGDRARWRALASELGIGDAVAFEGWLDRPGVAAAMARASVFVHPSPSETFGVVAAEAILSGLPVATRRSGGVPWIVELSGGFGAVATGDDEAAFARAIETVLDGHLPVDADDARARIVAEVGRDAVAARALACYEEAVSHATEVTEAGRPRGLRRRAPGHHRPRRPTSRGPRGDRARAGASTGRRAAGETCVPGSVLVTPPRPDDAASDRDGSPTAGIRLVEAAPGSIRAATERPQPDLATQARHLATAPDRRRGAGRCHPPRDSGRSAPARRGAPRADRPRCPGGRDRGRPRSAARSPGARLAALARRPLGS